MDERSDENLMRLVERGDEEAFDALLARHGPAARQRIDRIVRDAGAAEDLTQEAFLRVWTRPGQWSSRGTVAGWIMRIATNLALNHLRSVRRRPVRAMPTAMADDERDDWPADESIVDPAERMDQEELLQRFRRHVDRLPESKRTVMKMVHEDDMELADVAERLGIPLGTVKSRLHYACRRIARELGQAD